MDRLRALRIGWLGRGNGQEGAICVTETCAIASHFGDEAILYTEKAVDYPLPFETKLLPEEPSDKEWWQAQNLDAAIFYGFHDFSLETIRALKSCGTKVIIQCDTDGYLFPFRNPVRELLRRWNPRASLLHRLRSTKAFISSYASRTQLESEIISVCRVADILVVESELPGEILVNTFSRLRFPELAAKISIIPFAVRNDFCTVTIEDKRIKKVIAAGRLDSSQKNPFALIDSAKALSRNKTDVGLEIHCRGESRIFESALNGLPNITIYRNSTRQFLAERLANCQVFLSTSNWESTPIQAQEALCCGCTIVGPSSVPGYKGIIADGKYGQTFRTYTGVEMAVNAELKRWEERKRDPMAIANEWRRRCSPLTIYQLIRDCVNNCKS